jgi:hypothetical protein
MYEALSSNFSTPKKKVNAKHTDKLVTFNTRLKETKAKHQ